MTHPVPKMKLSYFDFDGGRGEPIRLALAYGNIPFEDHRIPGSDWPKVKEQFVLQQLPVMEVDGKIITQTNALSRFVGKMVGLYPADPLAAAHADEAMEDVEDLTIKMSPSMFIPDPEEKRRAREALAAGPIPLYLRRLGNMLAERGGQYFAGNQLSVADFRVFLLVRHLQSGALDHIPTDIVKQTAPGLASHFERINAVPQLVAYYKKRAAAA